MSDLGDPVQALRADPLSAQAASAVRDHARATGDLQLLAQAFAERGRSLLDLGQPAEAIGALVESAQIYEEELEDFAAAADLYERVLEIDGGHRRALFALGPLLHDLGRIDDLIALYRQRLDRAADDGEQTTLHLYISDLLSEKKGEHDAAFEEVMAAARLAPQNLRIITKLERLGEKTARLDEVAVVLGDLLLNQDDARVRAALSLRLAELYIGPLDDSARALACFRSVLVDDGANPEILSEVQDVFREQARFEELVELLEETSADRRTGPQRVRMERELARLYEHELRDTRRALAAVARTARANPDDRELTDEVMRLGMISSDMETVASTLEAVASGTSNALLRTYVLLKLGHVYGSTLDRPDDAIRVYRVIIELDPAHREARRRLARLYERKEAWGDLAALLDDEASLAESEDEELDILRRRVRILTERLADEAGAAAVFARILEIVPDDAEAAEAVERWRPPEPEDVLAQVGASAVEVAPGREGGTEDAAELVESAESAGVDAGEPMPSPEEAEAFAALDAFDEEATDPGVAKAVEAVRLTAPAPRAKVNEEIENRVVELQQKLQDATRADDLTAQAALLEEIVALNESVERHERAFFAAVRLVRLDPTAGHTRDLIRLGSLALTQRALVDTYDEIAGRLDEEAQVQLGIAIAEIEADELADVDAALLRLEALHDLAPGEAAVFERWTELLERDGRFEALISVLEREARRVSNDDRARALYTQASRIRDLHLGDPAGAAESLLLALERAPDDAEIRTEAARLLESAECWGELARLLEQDVYKKAGRERVALRRRIARLYQEHLADVASAEEMLRRALDEAPNDLEVVEQLTAILSAAEKWSDVVEVLTAQTRLVKGPRARGALRRRIAAIAEQQLERPDLALYHLEEAVRDDPADLGAIEDIERLRRARDDWPGVIRALELKARALSDTSARATALVEIAHIREDQLADDTGAAEAYRDALAIAPRHEDALDGYAALAERAGDYGGAIDALRDLARELAPKERAQVHARIGRILELHLEQSEEAAFEYQLALDADAECVEAIDRLRHYHERHGDPQHAIELCAKEAGLTADPRRRAMLWTAAAEIATRRLGDNRRALECYEAALDADPDDIATEATLGELYLAEGEAERAYAHLARAAKGLAHSASERDRALSLFVRAGAAAERLRMFDEAAAAYEDALELDPTSRKALDRLSDLSLRRGEHGRAHELCAALILNHEAELSPADLAGVYMKMARAKQALGEPAAAQRLAKKADALAPDDPAPLELLTELVAETGEVAAAAEHASQLAGRLTAPAERARALVRAAKLYADGVEDLDRAIALLAQAAELSPADVEVAELLAAYRERTGDLGAAAEGLAAAARRLEGRARADMLVEAAEIAAGAAASRETAKALLREALEIAPTHRDGLRDLSVMLEFDGDHAALAEVQEAAGRAFRDEPDSAGDADGEDRLRAAGRCFDSALRAYRFRLARPTDALRVARARRALFPKSFEVREDLARVLDEAAAAARGEVQEGLRLETEEVWAELVEERPGHLDGLRRLMALRSESTWPLKARITAELLVALGEASDDERRAAGRAPAEGSGEVTPPVDAPPVQNIEVPRWAIDGETDLSDLLEVLGLAPLHAFPDAIREPRVRRRDRVALEGLATPLANALSAASRVLGVALPPIYARDDAPGVIVPAFVEDEIALVVSGALAESVSAPVMRFFAGRALSLLRPRALVLELIPLDVLREGIEGLVRDALPPAHQFADPRRAKKRGRALEKALSPDQRADLASRVPKLLADPQRTTLGDERDAVLRTAERMGLVACGSLLFALDALGTSGRLDRTWFVPLVEFAASRAFAEVVAGERI